MVLVEPLQEHAQYGDLPHIAVPGLSGGAGVCILHPIPCFASRMLSLTVDSFAFVSFSSTPLGLHNSAKAPVLVGAHVLKKRKNYTFSLVVFLTISDLSICAEM